MLLGEYNHTLDAKNRIMLPAKLRDKLGSDVVIARSPYDPCLLLYRADDWNVFYHRVMSQQNDPDFITCKRYVFSSAFETTVDGQGRLLIQGSHCKFAGLTKDVTVIGVGDHLEIWSPEYWEQECKKENEADMKGLMRSVGFGI